MKTYTIKTDAEMMEDFDAKTIAGALEEFDAPDNVRDAASFEAWLRRVGGFGWIEEDGSRIAEVRS